MSTLTSRNLNFRPEINGLRAIAVILVIIFHLDPSWVPFGYVGVDMFFVISGFLITRIILKQQDSDQFSLKEFIAKRIKRIFPALFFMLFISAVCAVLIFSNEEHNYFFRSLRYASAQASNFFFLDHSGYFDLDSKYNALLHTWSLAVEEQFYLLWPILLLVIHKFKVPKPIFLLIISLLSFWSMFYLKQNESLEYFFMFYARAWEFCIGGFLALGVIRPLSNKTSNQIIAIISSFSIILALIFSSNNHPAELYYLILTCLGVAGIIYSSSIHQTWISNILSYKAFLIIGLLSYSLYLWHWPVIVFYNYITEFSYSGQGIAHPDNLSILSVIIIITITLALSVITYKYIEKPFRYNKLKYRTLFSISIITVASFMGLAKFEQGQSKAKWRLNVFSTEASLEDLEINLSKYKTQNQTEDILLIGDSHAKHFTPMISTWAEKNHQTSKILAQGATPPLPIYNQFKDSLDGREKRHLNKIKDHIINNPNIQHVILAADHYKYQDQPGYEEALSDTIQFIIKHGKGVCLIGQTPALRGEGIRYLEPTHFMNWLFPNRVSKRTILNIDHDFNSQRSSKMNQIMKRLKTKYPSIQLWYPNKYLLHGLQNNLPCYADKTHLNEPGSLYLAPYFQYDLSATTIKSLPAQ